MENKPISQLQPIKDPISCQSITYKSPSLHPNFWKALDILLFNKGPRQGYITSILVYTTSDHIIEGLV